MDLTPGFRLSLAISYQINNEANDFEAGDVARLGGSLQYRLWPGTLGSGVPAFLYGVIEANLIHQQKNQVNGYSNPDLTIGELVCYEVY